MDGDHEDRCIRAIEHGVVDDDVPSRRRRVKVLAVDRDGDVAAVLLATRGKRRDGRTTVTTFHQDGSTWRGGASSASRSHEHGRLPDRSTVAPTTLSLEASGRALHSNVGFASMRAGSGVTHVVRRGEARAVPRTGYTVVVWRGRRMPDVPALDAEGREVDRVTHDDMVSPLDRMPWYVRLRMRWSSCRHGGDWFNYSPGR